MTKLLQLKIELAGITPKIWGRFLVRNDVSFQNLHETIQIVMGWGDYHMYEFRIGEASIISEEGFNPAEKTIKILSDSPEFHKLLKQTVRESKKGGFVDRDKVNKILEEARKKETAPKFTVNTKLSKLIHSEGQKFYYTYDFGDTWRHAIKVEKIMEASQGKRYPECLGGERSCPPEDCGGVGGYYELQEIKKNKNPLDYRERIVEWLGEEFDFELFNVDEVNKELLEAFS